MTVNDVGIIIVSICALVVIAMITVPIVSACELNSSLPTKAGWVLEASGNYDKLVDCYGKYDCSIGGKVLPSESQAGNYFKPTGEQVHRDSLVIGNRYNIYTKVCAFIPNHLIESIDCK